VTVDTASLQFIAFGLLVAAISNLGRSHAWRSTVLFVSSVGFLSLLAPNSLLFLPLAGFLMLGYGGLWLNERGRVWSVVALCAVIFAYAWLKKYTFLPESIFLRSPYFTLGLSYIFFRVLHLLIESAEPERHQRIGPVAYLIYTLNFTTLVSGPIQRYGEFARDQFADVPINLDASIVGLQLERIIRGFFKVNVLAMLFQLIHEKALSQMSQPLPPGFKCLAAFTLATVYPLFLYANFSGYIDIVIALARLMRIRLPENFDRPFSASSFLDFWNRWHITLSTWLKTYVYNPLLMALMRRSSSTAVQPFLGVFCFFVTFFLVGVWHGRTSEFVVFGVLQGGGVATNKLWQLQLMRIMGRKRYKALAGNPVYVALGRGLTYSWFAFTLFWFWANWQQIEATFSGIGVVEWAGVWLAICMCAAVVLALWERMRAGLLRIQTADGPALTSRYARVAFASALGLAAFIITELLSLSAPDLVYKAF
jgi:alginate O-acetyltransferase complex protein AlgI